jgi:hypothetical protein
MIPAGYMAKRVHKATDWLQPSEVVDIYSVSGCISEDFADYINHWKHNGYWFFNSPEIIRSISVKESVALEGTSLFYYEAHALEFDGKSWLAYAPEHPYQRMWYYPRGSNSRDSTWLLSTLGRLPNVLHCRATGWRKNFSPMPTVCLIPSKRLKRRLRLERSKILSRPISNLFRLFGRLA